MDNNDFFVQESDWRVQKESRNNKLKPLCIAFFISAILAFAAYFGGLGPVVVGIPWCTFIFGVIIKTYHNSATTRDQLEESLEEVVKQNVSLKEQNEQLLRKLERIETVLNIPEESKDENSESGSDSNSKNE